MTLKRKIVLLPALILAATLASCGQGDNTNQAPNAPASTATAPGTDVLIVDVASPSVGHLVGELQPGKGLVSNGAAGFLMFGGYFDLPAGDYRVTVHGTMQAPAGSSATFDIVHDKGIQTLKKQVSSAEDPSKSVLTTLEFKLPRATRGIEVRALVPADVQMTLTGYTVTRLP